MQKNPMLLTKLRTLKKQHLEMSEVVQLLNDSLSTQIEWVLSLYFVDVTFNIYKFVALYSGTFEIESFLSVLCYAIFYTAHIIVIVLIIEITKGQIRKIGSNIHQVLVHTFDEQVTTELELFSLQVLQKGATFVMKGLVIDATFLTKVNQQ
ncbi:hypothetical protein K0M31_010816 [Melipona bicolor]|uniref:Gustatory receptor n=1 Tax=Melipona bicolor TaxID=60889 RepID=A0AA40KHZ1_9HYME|nr:hypothetical protein K0M31_010816 [Melipona bicolor]